METFKLIDSDVTHMASSVIEFRSPLKEIGPLNLLTPPLTGEAVAPKMRVSDTPCSHRSKLSNSLTFAFQNKCLIYCDNAEETRPERCIKRCRTDHVVTPNKKSKPFVKLLFEADETLQEQKENSPIKIEMETEYHGVCANKVFKYCSFTLKPPPIKISPYIFCVREIYCDIFSGLEKRGMHHVMQKIVTFLKHRDLLSLKRVSSHYKDIFTQLVSRETLGVARAKVLKSKENVGEVPVVRIRNETTPKKLFRINKYQSPKRRAPSPSQLSPSSKRFHYYLQTAKTLDKSERLEKCPRCSYPAKRNELVATCSGCNYSFCVQCRSNPHINKVCNFFIPSPESPDSRKSRRWGIGTNANRKALRRL